MTFESSSVAAESSTAERAVLPAPAPEVTVIVTTYNQEEYLGRALESVLRQVAPFTVHVMVLDDASSDGTSEVIDSFKRNHPTRIEHVRAPYNTNDTGLVADAIDACQSPYIALLDGDDYWLSEHKLAKQVAFLEVHPECVLSFHDIEVRYDSVAPAEDDSWLGPQSRSRTLMNFGAAASCSGARWCFVAARSIGCLSGIGAHRSEISSSTSFSHSMESRGTSKNPCPLTAFTAVASGRPRARVSRPRFTSTSSTS